MVWLKDNILKSVVQLWFCLLLVATITLVDTARERDDILYITGYNFEKTKLLP